jgi:hypothetical protein
MTLNMDDDLDMSMRAPYISMSESSELPMLIAEDLMWGAQPDLKLTLNKKLELNFNHQLGTGNCQKITANSSQQQKSTTESSLASLLCSQLLQHQQQQISDHQKEQQIILNQHPGVKIKILDNLSIVNPNAFTTQNQDTRMGWCRRTIFCEKHILIKSFFGIFSARNN